MGLALGRMLYRPNRLFADHEEKVSMMPNSAKSTSYIQASDRLLYRNCLFSVVDIGDEDDCFVALWQARYSSCWLIHSGCDCLIYIE